MFFKPKYNPRYPEYFNRFAWSSAGVITVLSILGLLGKLHWTLDGLSHFRVQYLQLALLIAGVCLWVRRNKCAAVLILIAAFNYIFIFPLYLDKPAATGVEKPMRAMLLNLNASNGNTELVLRTITNASPDLVFMEEVTPDWAFELSRLADHYPHSIIEPRDDCFGIMLLSKHPLSRGAVVEIGTAGVPSITADVHLPHGDVSVIGTHPLPPLGPAYAKSRNHQLAALPEAVQAQRHPVLLIGDLNVTQWSPYFTKLLRESGLKDSMKGFGFQPTWPSNKAFMRIPLDHVLHSPEIIIHNRMVGSKTGSDHLPVIVDFSIR